MTVERTGGSGSSEENRPHTAQPAKYRTQIIRQKIVLQFLIRFFSKFRLDPGHLGLKAIRLSS